MSSIRSSASLGHKCRVLTGAGLLLAAPLLVVGGFLALLLAVQLAAYHGDVAGLVTFGHHQIADTHPPAGTPIISPDGYDGQLYWIQAHDPLLLHRSTIAHLVHAYPGYFLQRPAYPALAFLLSGGHASALPWAMLAINVICLLGLTVAVSRWAVAHGRSAWWGAVIGLTPGLLMPVLRDLTDVLAVTTMLGGLLAWQADRRWTAAGLLSLAVLSREPMTLAVAAIALEAVALSWKTRGWVSAWRKPFAAAWPPVMIPALAFVGWQLYIRLHVGATAAAAASPVTPMIGYRQEFRAALSSVNGAVSLWDLAYLGLMIGASLIALSLLLRSRPSAASISAFLFALTLTVIVFGDQWGETRYSAPMFAALLMAGLERGSRAALGACGAAATLVLVVPLAIPGI